MPNLIDCSYSYVDSYIAKAYYVVYTYKTVGNVSIKIIFKWKIESKESLFSAYPITCIIVREWAMLISQAEWHLSAKGVSNIRLLLKN